MVIVFHLSWTLISFFPVVDALANNFCIRFASITKPKQFYEKHANGENGKRCYFYNIDLQGRLYLEESMPKNITSCIKDTRFLNLFFRRLQRVDDEQREWMEANGISSQEYPFVSPCGGKEWNMVRPAAVPIVFHTLTNESDDCRQQFLFGGDMAEPFDEENGFAISRVNGRLYHKFTAYALNRCDRNRNENAGGLPMQDFGLIRSSVAVALSNCMVPIDGEDLTAKNSGVVFETKSKNQVPIPWLPLRYEPGSWGLPSDVH